MSIMGTLEGPRFRTTVRAVLRDCLLDAAAELICTHGWKNVRMADIAERAGVSRRTVFNEFGSKAALAQAAAWRNVERYFAGVDEALDAHRGDVVEAIQAAVEYTLKAAAEDPLLKAVLTADPGSSEELLPLLTTQSGPFVSAATAFGMSYVRRHWPHLGLDDDTLEFAVDSVVRLTISHIMLPPASPPEQTAKRIGWLASGILASAASGSAG
jgi:AcrR family transcriptional regulator